jgi:hypothetical protein
MSTLDEERQVQTRPLPRFRQGDWVQDRNNRGFFGVVVRPPTRAGRIYWYDVRTPTGQRNTLPGPIGEDA